MKPNRIIPINGGIVIFFSICGTTHPLNILDLGIVNPYSNENKTPPRYPKMITIIRAPNLSANVLVVIVADVRFYMTVYPLLIYKLFVYIL